MKIANEFYTMPDVQTEIKGHWVTARPELYSPNIFQKIKHLLGFHWSYGQPYCVICGKKEANQ